VTSKLLLDAVRIGDLDGDLFDPRLAWAQYRGISAKGAVLIRPDRVVGWRCADGVADAESELADALSRILGRDIYTAAECTA
jgi:2,4-dichlorophenol 6-monooxygenase